MSRHGNNDLVMPLLTFLDTLQSRLPALTAHASAADHSSLQADLKSHINTIRNHSKIVASRTDPRVIEKKGVNLWNLATRHSRAAPSDDSSIGTKVLSVTLGLLKSLAFLLLACGYKPGRSTNKTRDWEDGVKLLRSANRAARTCLDTAQLDLCTAIFERAADIEKWMEQNTQSLPTAPGASTDEYGNDNDRIYQRLKLEYLGLRILLAWKQDKLDMAETMYSKIVLQRGESSPEASAFEHLADLLFEVGKGLHNKHEPSRAARWLRRAMEILADQNMDLLSPDALELRLSIMHYLVRALLSIRTDVSHQEANTILDALEKDYDDKMVVAMLRLDLLTAEDSPDMAIFSNVLNRLIRIVHVTYSTFNTIMNYIHRLKDKSPLEACSTLDDFLTLRLVEVRSPEWTNKVFVTRLWIVIESLYDNAEALESLTNIMDKLFSHLEQPLDTATTHAAHVLIWKRIGSEYKEERFGEAEYWARLSQHKLFSLAGDLNSAVIARKVLQCSIERNDLESANKILDEMPENVKRAPLTQFLAYKLALRNGDEALASDCLASIAQTSSTQTDLLYACVAESQQSSNKSQAIAALRSVMISCDHNVANGVHFPALLRCIGRLLISDLPVQGQKDERGVAKQLCDIFETAAKQVAQKAQGIRSRVTDQFVEGEVEWFTKNSYNLGLQYYGEWPRDRSIRILEAFLEFERVTPMKIRETDDYQLHTLVAHVLVCNASINLARSSDEMETKTGYYRRAHGYAEKYVKHLDIVRDSHKRLGHELLKNDFEAAIHLQDWEHLPTVAQASLPLQDQQLFGILVDMTIQNSLEVPSLVQLKILEIIITATRADGNPNILSRWLRTAYRICIFPIATTASTNNATLTKADMILSQALALARQAPPIPISSDDGADQPRYAAEEIEYLATVTFNRAIDAYCVGDDTTCQRLADVAVELAACLDSVDAGALRDALVVRRESLRPVEVEEGGDEDVEEENENGEMKNLEEENAEETNVEEENAEEMV